ncbi:MAG: mechanosensitive ion channel family protein [Candidatus Geothermincolia bacterium]
MVTDFAKDDLEHLIIAGIVILVAAVSGWLLKHIVDRYVRRQVRKDVMDPGMQTKAKMTGKLILAFIYTLGFALALFQFPRVRAIGTGLLASAGVLGLVLGLAAQNSLANIMAGITLAFSQPFRLGDRIFVEGEHGAVEEIHLTYTFIRTDDNRRLILPNRILASQAIINYSIVESRITARVDLWVDYRADFDAVRTTAVGAVHASPFWDGESEPQVSVVETTEKAVKVRLLAEAQTPAAANKLGLDVRERVITLLREANIPFPC